MASTNKTANYNLSQYIGTDKPTYLSDYNTDMFNIDTQMKVNADNVATAISSVETATTTANTANTNAQTAISTANSASTTASEASTTASNAQTTANSALATATTAQSTANSNTSKIGDLTNLTTIAKTDLVSAINDVNAEIHGTVLWTNPSPDADMNTATITLSSGDYDTLKIFYKHLANNPYIMSEETIKGAGTYIESIIGGVAVRREISSTNDTTLSVGAPSNSNLASLIPNKIIGYKLD